MKSESEVAKPVVGGSAVQPNKKYRRRYVLGLLFLVMICTLILPICLKVASKYFPIAGGVWGMLCSGFVVIEYLRLPAAEAKESPALKLLFWRCVADFGLALRFIATPGFNQLICGENYCNFLEWKSSESNCGFASAMFEFFQISSEAWFVCVSADLYFSITRPFSRFQDRLPYYHLFAWGSGLAFSIPTGAINTISGYWYVAARDSEGYVEESTILSTDIFCWIQIEPAPGDVLSWKPWVMFYVPLIFSYVFSVAVLYNAFKRLRTGISFTFIHRLKVLFTNSINISTCLMYWSFLFVVYVLTFAFDFAHDKSTVLFDMLMYFIPAKGASSIMVWILVSSIDFTVVKQMNASENIDLNSALREEVLLYASEGVRKSCKHFSNMKKDGKDVKKKKELTFVLKQALDESGNFNNKSGPEDSDIISGWNFFMLVLGFQEPLIQLRAALKLRLQAKKDVLTNVRQSITRASIVGSMPNFDKDAEHQFLASIKERSESKSVSSRASSERELSDTIANPMMSHVDTARASSVNMRTKPSLSTVESTKFPLFLVGEDDIASGKISDNFDDSVESTVPPNKCTVWWSSIKKILGDLFCWPLKSDKIEVEFTEFSPYHFGCVRDSVGLDDDMYRYLFLERVKERLTSGGASGAFFFFCKDEFLIAKSCTEEEADVLLGNAEKYSDYMCNNKNSYISKIYGCYLLKIYDTKLYFMVMNNIFLNDRAHNNLVKYDIKGSWVSRNADLPRNGDVVTCKFCEQKYSYTSAKKKKKLNRATTRSGSFDSSRRNTSLETEDVQEKNTCSATVDRQHEALVIYKDNDLREKILLPPNAAGDLLLQLKRDATYLYSVGVMDYSLLVGVHYTKYAVNTTEPQESDDSDDKFIRGSIWDVEQGLRDTEFSQEEIENSVKERKALKQLQYCVPLEVGRVVGPDCYYLGIIDFQQTWTWNKVLERFAKVWLSGKDADGLSAINVETYYQRFCDKMDDLFHLEMEDDESVDSMPSPPPAFTRTLSSTSSSGKRGVSTSVNVDKDGSIAASGKEGSRKTEDIVSPRSSTMSMADVYNDPVSKRNVLPGLETGL